MVRTLMISAEAATSNQHFDDSESNKLYANFTPKSDCSSEIRGRQQNQIWRSYRIIEHRATLSLTKPLHLTY